MIDREPKMFSEEEADKKLKAISEQKQREMALDLLAQQIVESVSEEELDELMEKVKKRRDSGPIN